MKKEAIITLEIDEDLKNEIEEICNKEGISLDTAINFFVLISFFRYVKIYI